MATASSFKLTCPSCEESVPIRDPKLIGKKIDCPTCKYRFVVEQPNGAAKTNGAAAQAKPEAAPKNRLRKTPAETTGDSEQKSRKSGKSPPPRKSVPGLEDMEEQWQEEAEADADANDKKKKKKKKKKKGAGFSIDFKKDKLKLGLALAGVCVVLLAIAGVAIMFLGGGNKPTRSRPSYPPNRGELGNANEKEKTKKRPRNNGGGPDPVLAAAKAAFTNLLPPDTEHVAHLHVDEFRNSPAGAAAFSRRGLDNKETVARLGFSPNDVDQILHGENYTDGWAFNAIHAVRAFSEPALVKALGLKDAGSIEKQKYYAIGADNLWLEEFGRLSLAARRAVLTSKQQKADERVLYVRLHDAQTLIVANRLPMQAFLKVKGKFPARDQKEKTKLPGRPKLPGQPPPGPGGEVPPGPAGPGGPGAEAPPGPAGPGGPAGGLPPAGPGDVPPGAAGPGGPGGDAPPGIAPPDPGQAGGFPQGGPNPGQTPGYGGNPFERPSIGPPIYRTLRKPLRDMMRRLEELPAESKTKIIFTSATDMSKAQMQSPDPLQADRIVWRLRLMWDVTRLLAETSDRIQILGVSVRQREQRKYQLQNVLVCANENQARSLADTLQDESAAQVQHFFKTLFGHEITIAKDEPAKKPTYPGGMTPGGIPPGGAPPGGAPPTSSPPGSSPSPGGGAPPPPGGVPGSSSPSSPMPGGFPPGGGAEPGYTPGQYGKNKAKEVDVKKSQIAVKRSRREVTFTFDLVLGKQESRGFRQAFALVTQGLVNQLNASQQSFPRLQLGAAVKALGEQGLSARKIPAGEFPPGAFRRYNTTRRAAQDPLERVSWMAGLLPYLGQQSLFESVDFDRSWKDPANWLAARTIVPQFIDPAYPPHLRTVNYRGLPFPAAATHYVGVAGVGLDAASYEANDPAVVGKVGVFGYDRRTSLQEISKGRGLSNTIVIIQVPADGVAGINPWMAGGGSTIRGVPEKNSFQPFIGNHGRYGRGAFVITADGSVRFLSAPKKISDFDRVFQAMCTVNGPSPQVDLGMVGKRIERPKPAPTPKKSKAKEKKATKSPDSKSKSTGKKQTPAKAPAQKIEPPRKIEPPQKSEPPGLSRRKNEPPQKSEPPGLSRR